MENHSNLWSITMKNWDMYIYNYIYIYVNYIIISGQ